MKFEDFVKIWIEKSFEAEKEGKTIFVNYLAHVHKIEISIYTNGWKSGSRPDITLEFKKW